MYHSFYRFDIHMQLLKFELEKVIPTYLYIEM